MNFFGRLLFIVKLGRLLAESNITLLFHPLIQLRKCYFSACQRICVLTYYPHPIIQNKRQFSHPHHLFFPYKFPLGIFLDNYLKTRKSHFLGAWKTVIVTRSCGGNEYSMVKKLRWTRIRHWKPDISTVWPRKLP